VGNLYPFLKVTWTLSFFERFEKQIFSFNFYYFSNSKLSVISSGLMILPKYLWISLDNLAITVGKSSFATIGR
jgi:hypothetical protein